MNQAAKLAWRKIDTPPDVAHALELLTGEYPVSEGGRGLKLKFRKVDSSETVSRVLRNPGEVTIEYSTLSGALRGVGSALAKLDGEEHSPFEKLGIMLDLSRNMVMRVEHFKKWLRRLALCGCNEVLLYCEDTYELEDQPFFGAYRAPYTMDELREMDDYANTLGIELIGCIQTLGHMEQLLQHRYYEQMTDSERIMLVDSPETEALIRKMIKFWSEALRSRRIHVGMDEAHGLGRGKHQTLHGAESETSLMTRHLDLVSGICKENGLAPMIWSDMFFRMTNKNHEYYDYTSPFPAGLKKQIDPSTQLVYWDYYHTDCSDYRKMISRHRELGKEPVVASGIWTWVRMWYDHRKTMDTALPCIDVCRQEKIKDLFFTMWGDDGAYCNWDSSLAGIVRCADLAYGRRDENDSADRFEAICEADYSAHVAAGDIRAEIPCAGDKVLEVLPSMLLWDDPLLGKYFAGCKRANPEFDLIYLDILDDTLCRIMPSAEDCRAGDIGYAVDLIKFLMKKLELRGALEAAYDLGDRLALRELVTTTIPAAIAALVELDAGFRRNWLKCAKAHGLERIQIRNAGQMARLEELSIRIREFLDGTVERIEELDERLPYSLPPENLNRYKEVSSGSWIN